MRRLNLTTGFVGDSDWTIPSNSIPNSVRQMRVVATEIVFAFVGMAGTEPNAAAQDVGLLTVNAWVGTSAGEAVVRGLDVEEVNGESLSARIIVRARDTMPGSSAWLNVENLATVGLLPALWIYVLAGARVL